MLFLGLGSIFPSLCSINCFPLPPVQQIQVKIRKEKERLRVKIISREHFCELNPDLIVSIPTPSAIKRVLVTIKYTL